MKKPKKILCTFTNARIKTISSTPSRVSKLGVFAAIYMQASSGVTSPILKSYHKKTALEDLCRLMASIRLNLFQRWYMPYRNVSTMVATN